MRIRTFINILIHRLLDLPAIFIKYFIPEKKGLTLFYDPFMSYSIPLSVIGYKNEKNNRY